MDGNVLDIQVLNARDISVPSFRFPAGIYLIINDNDLWKTSIKALLDDSTVVWDETIELGCMPVMLIMKLRASLEFGERLGNGELIGETQVRTSTLKGFGDSVPFDVFFPAINKLKPILKLQVSFRPGPNTDSASLMPPPHNLINKSERTIALVTDEGHAHFANYMAGRGSSHLMEALQCYKRALIKCANDQNHWARAAALTNFAWAHLVGFDSDNESAEDADTIIIYFREALKLRPFGHPDHVLSLYHLAYALSLFHEEDAPPANLHESASLFCTLLPLCAEHTFIRYVLLEKHGLDDMIEKCNDVPTCGSADDILFRRRVAVLCRVGHESCPMTFEMLARALCQRGGLDEIEESIKLRRALLISWPGGRRLQSVPLNRLISTLIRRFILLRHPCDLDEVLNLSKESVRICPAESNKDDLAVLLNNLGIVLARRFISLDDSNDINHAIVVIREAWGMSRNRKRLLTLMIVLLRRHFTEDLAAAIELCRESKLLEGPESEERQTAMGTVCSAFCSGFRRSVRDEPACKRMKVAVKEEDEDGKEQGTVDIANVAFGKWIQGVFTSK